MTQVNIDVKHYDLFKRLLDQKMPLDQIQKRIGISNEELNNYRRKLHLELGEDILKGIKNDDRFASSIPYNPFDFNNDDFGLASQNENPKNYQLKKKA